MSEKKCIEYVTDSGGWYRSQCGKKAGHGSGGFYCKRHASRHPSGEEETVTWYKMGVLGQIVPVQVERYTDKTLTILGRGRVAIGGYYRTRSEVILAEIEKQEKKINAYQMQLRLAEQCVVKLRALLAKENEPQMNND